MQSYHVFKKKKKSDSWRTELPQMMMLTAEKGKAKGTGGRIDDQKMSL